MSQHCQCQTPAVDQGPSTQNVDGRSSDAWGISPMEHVTKGVERVLRAPGKPLDHALQMEMGDHFGHDFSRVRLHHDPASAQSLGARAYTLGQDIVFDEVEKYSPDRDLLLLHELAHTVQQPNRRWQAGDGVKVNRSPQLEGQARRSALQVLAGAAPPNLASTGLGVQRQEATGPASRPAARTGRAPASGAGAGRGRPNDVIAIRLAHRENGGLGRFDTILYRNCDMKVQIRMNFTWLGDWPNEREKQEWQQRYISGIETAWSRKFDLEAAGTCSAPCRRVSPFVRIYAPHNAPHVNVDVTYTDTYIQSRAGYGVAHLDSEDLTPTTKRRGTEQQVPSLHEFGHLIGRDDQNRPGGTCAPGYPLQGVMCYGNTVQAADYQPFANALQQMTGCTYNVVPRRRTRPSPIPVRRDFIPEMIRSTEEI